jgi:hypothetical protein
VKIRNNIKMLKGEISESIGYPSVDVQCALYTCNDLANLKAELSKIRRFKWDVPDSLEEVYRRL